MTLSPHNALSRQRMVHPGGHGLVGQAGTYRVGQNSHRPLVGPGQLPWTLVPKKPLLQQMRHPNLLTGPFKPLRPGLGLAGGPW